MLTGRQKNVFKIILILLALSMTLLIEPILAEQQHNRSKSKPQRQIASATQRSVSIIKTPTNITAKVRSGIPRINVNSHSIPQRFAIARSNLTRIAKSNTNSSFNILSRSSSRTSGNVISSIGKQITLNQGNKISSSRNSSLIVTRRPSAITMATTSSTSRDSRTITNKISGGLVGRRNAAAQVVIRAPAVAQSNGTNLGNRTLFGEAPSRSRISSIKMSRIAAPITNQSRSASIARHGKSSRLLKTLRAIDGKTTGDRAKAGSLGAKSANRTPKSINLKVVDRLRTSLRHEKSTQKRQADIANVNTIENAGQPAAGLGISSKRYREHPPVVRNKHRYEHVYWDYHNQLRHRIIWPRYRFTVCYRHGPRFVFRYVYPYYLRRYVFISLGGYWPLDYSYIRYYWYGCHPYYWYGYYPIAREVGGDTYNYYTYNYYYGDNGIVPSVSTQEIDGIKPVDHNTFADVREKLAQQAKQEPALETAADIYFDEAVKAFEAGSYEIAIEKFSEAQALAVDDMVLPFAYSQALFANEQYAEAADVLRTTLENVSPEKEGVFYPRGLYPDDEILFEQIEHLSQKAELYYFDADLQLLLGYHLLGIGEIDKAIEPLQQAGQDLKNATAATTLLDLLTKISPALGGQGADAEVENND